MMERLLESDDSDMKKSCSRITPILPPCRICGAKASGFHYGVNACQACKSFYRRSRLKKDDYECFGTKGNCMVKAGKRPPCPYCRYQKCLKLGMAREASKNGRYTLERRHKNIEEVKLLELDNSLDGLIEGMTRANNYAIPEMSPESDILDDKPEIKQNEKETQIRDYLEKQKVLLDEYRVDYNNFVRVLPERQARYKENKKLQELLFGKMTPIPRDEYVRIYENTGIDVDGRKDIYRQWLPYVEHGVKELIKFSKHIPGFKDLCQADKITLIKVMRYDVWMLGELEAYNPKEKLFTGYNGVTADINDMQLFYALDREAIEREFEVAARLQDLNLSYEEQVTLVAVLILSADEKCLKEPQKVRQIKLFMEDVFRFLVKRNRLDDYQFLEKVNEILADSSELAMVFEKSVSQFTGEIEWLKVEVPELVREFLSP